jgi:hypothetical protein
MSRAITHIVVHHSAGNGGTLDEIRSLHVRGNGWSDIGYHKLITNGRDIGGKPSTDAADGDIFSGRPESRAGAHCSNASRGGAHNSYTLGVCVTGNFEISEPSLAQERALAVVIATWCAVYRIPIDRSHIRGHREMVGHASNNCPGRFLLARLDVILNRAKKLAGSTAG